VPTGAELPDRLSTVLRVIYLVFTEGHAPSSGAGPVRTDLCAEAVRLAATTAALLPDEPEAVGLHALLLLQHARRDTRVDAEGRLVLLAEQDRSRWDADALRSGLALARTAARRVALPAAGPYLLQAAIAAEHARAATAADTDWARIALLYRVLEERTGSPVVRLNRAVAVAETAGPAAGLALLDGLDDRLAGYHLLPATRADLLLRLGRREQARAAYTRALALARTDADRRFLTGRLSACAAGSPPQIDPTTQEVHPMGGDKSADKAEQIETGVEEALGQATDDTQTHSAEDQTGGAPAPPEHRDEDAYRG
jgi:RNA polymerase sigma-70 factor (ECF subfamily)